jgi:glutaminase
MDLLDPLVDPENFPYSTGQLPPADRVARLLQDAHRRFSTVASGEVSRTYPALARVPAQLFGISVVGVDGRVFSVGDAEREFAMMSVAKPFLFALVCDLIGATGARERLGVNATGHAFNSLAGIERNRDGRTNPMVNAGAIATISLVPGADVEAKWEFVRGGLSRFAGRELAVDAEVLASAAATNFRNRSIAWFLHSVERLYCDPTVAVDLYTRQSSLAVTAKDLAVMGATLANGGVNPVTQQRVVRPDTCHYALAVMLTAGLYETSGDWLYEIGLPGKSGIGGGIATVSPGKGGLGTFSPPLDEAGNSVRGQLVAQFLSQRLGLNLLASRPVRPATGPGETLR